MAKQPEVTATTYLSSETMSIEEVLAIIAATRFSKNCLKFGGW